jgi:hypothetical protein
MGARCSPDLNFTNDMGVQSQCSNGLGAFQEGSITCAISAIRCAFLSCLLHFFFLVSSPWKETRDTRIFKTLPFVLYSAIWTERL